jgi:hypothetical protein
MVRGSSAGAMLNIKHNKAEKIKIKLNIDTKDIYEKLEDTKEKRNGKQSRMGKSIR